MWNDFSAALSFLTIFRLPRSSCESMSFGNIARSLSFFPAVGFLLGACWLAPAYLLWPRMPPLLLAVLLTVLMAILTRALHLDGLADLADGVGGAYTAERRLEIMKDSRTGAFGALALVFAVLLKSAALHTLILHQAWPPLLLVPMFSRFGIVLASYKAIYPRREGGLGKPFLEHITFHQILLASLFTITLSLLLARLSAFLYITIVLFIVGASRRLSSRWLGGTTGDVLGAVNEITEVVLLCFAACFTGNL